jgi:hypothetical protein
LQIGYILFQSEEAVIRAVETLNGCRFIGRDIRVLAYDPKSPTEPSTTGLVHVSFKTMTPQQSLVTEATLRQCFDSFGEIEHVAIRTHKFTEMGLQGGYGFLTFRLPDQNRTVVEQVRQVVIDGILYDCSWSALHTQKGWDGEDVIVDPKHGLIAAKSNSTEPSVPQPATESSTVSVRGPSATPSGHSEKAYYAPRQATHARPHALNAAADLNYRGAEHRDLEARRRMDHMTNASYHQYNPPAPPGSHYDKRHPLVTPGDYPLSAYGQPRGYPVDYERERIGLPRPDYFGNGAPPAVGHPYRSRTELHYDPRDPYYDLRGRLGAPPAHPYPAGPAAPRYPPPRDYPARDSRYVVDEYEHERRACYGSEYPVEPVYPYHRSEGGYSQSSFDAGMRRGGQMPAFPPRRNPGEEQSGGPYGYGYERDYLESRRGTAPNFHGMTQDTDLLDRAVYSRYQRTPGEHPDVGYASRDFDEYGLPVGRNSLNHPGSRKTAEFAEVDAFGLPKVLPGRNFLSEFGTRPEFLYASEKSFQSTILEAHASSTSETVSGNTELPAAPMSSSPRDTSGSVSSQISRADPFRMTDMVDAIWKTESSYVPLEPLEADNSVSLPKMVEVNSELPDSIEPKETVPLPAEDSRPPGLPNATFTAATKQSTDADLDALIDE